MASVLMIKKSALASFPENVRSYVEKYFKEKNIFGEECLVAERHTYHPNGSSYAKWDHGMAPCHSVNLMQFGKSEEGHEVNEVLRRAIKERPDDVVEIYVTERSFASDVYDD